MARAPPTTVPGTQRTPMVARRTVLSVAIGAQIVGLGSARILKDEIKQLPGWEGPLPSRHYSGYIAVPGDHGPKMYHYWFVESESDPENDPVGLWLNGGPGSSSLIGMMTENGPFMTNDDSLKEALPYGNDTVPKLFHRDYHWAKSASYIWLESPAGVGFSYCDYGIMNKTTGAKYPCTANDTSTAKDNHEVLKEFFKGFPEFARNEFFITGESYAGIYIPTLAEQIMLDKQNQINLKGLAIGNGCWGSAVGLCSFGCDMDRIWQQFLYGHNAITPIAYKKIIAACGDPMDGPGSWSNCTGQGPVCSNMLKPSDRYASDACQSALNNVSADEFTGQGKTANYEIYNYYDTCYSTSDIRRRLEHKHAGMTTQDREAMIEHLRNGGEFGAAVHIGEKPLTSGGALNDYTCGGMGAMGKWLEQPEVIAALHVENDGTHRYPGAVAYGPRTEGDLRPLYKTLAQKYKLMIYSGDTDACVPTVGTEEWTADLGFPVIREWQPWHGGTPNNATAHFVTSGYVIEYDAGTKLNPNHNFTFLTVKGAGHTVPEFKPIPMYQALMKFFNGEVIS